GGVKASPLVPAGRWSRFRAAPDPTPSEAAVTDQDLIEFAAERLLDRYGIVFRRVLERERIPVAWRDLARVYRHLELRGDVRGGRFVQRFAGEQYARPEAVELTRRLRRSKSAAGRGLKLSAADPLNLEGILTPEPRVPSQARRRVLVA